MKTPIAITLIIAGSLILLAPAFSDHLARSQAASIMKETKLTSITLSPPPMSPMYRLGCYTAGCVMIILVSTLSVTRQVKSKEE